MNNTWCRIAVCVFLYMASSASAALSQEVDFVLVSLEQLRDRLERDDKGTLDAFVADVSAASGLSAAASRDSLISLLAELKDSLQEIHSTWRTAFCAARGAFFRARGQGVLGAGCGYGRRPVKERRERWAGAADCQSGEQK